MSHKEEIVCPNCGFKASHNYCAQCGQETHLHKDTFWGLVLHFVGHYFHYDSKFWKTLRALVTKPGSLTIAYRNKQRMRYIPPISLYLFVSALFFLLFFTVQANRDSIYKVVSATEPMTKERLHEDSVRKAGIANTVRALNIKQHPDDTAAIRKFHRAGEMFKDPAKQADFLVELVHFAPKLFFFMIPFMAAILSLIYFKRKDIFFTDHTIFSLHLHSMVFLLLLITLPDVPDKPNFFQSILSFIQNCVPFVAAFYFVVALRGGYGTGWLRSVLLLVLVTVSYALIFFIVYVAYFVTMLYLL